MSSTPLGRQVDETDLETALESDLDGSFGRKVQAYLDESQRAFKAAADAGLSPDEFAAQEKLQAAVAAAGDVLRFVTDQRLAAKAP